MINRKTISNRFDTFFKKKVKQILTDYLNTKAKIHLIQIGANDGVSIDSIYPILQNQQKVKALVVEPVPFLFEKLVRNYQSNPNVTPLQIAITSDAQEITKPFFYLKPNELDDYNPDYSLWGSFSRSHIMNHIGKDSNALKFLHEEQVRCITINELYRQTGFDNIEILATDAEGYDEEILNSIDFNLFSPDLILFEHYHIPTSNMIQLILKLKSHNYRCYSRGYDTICVKSDLKNIDISLRLTQNIFFFLRKVYRIVK